MARVTVIPLNARSNAVISYLKGVADVNLSQVEEERLQLTCSRRSFEKIRQDLEKSAIVIETITLEEFLARGR